MAYVDLNPIRAGVAENPETSLYTSIWERIHESAAGRDMAGTQSLTNPVIQTTGDVINNDEHPSEKGAFCSRPAEAISTPSTLPCDLNDQATKPQDAVRLMMHLRMKREIGAYQPLQQTGQPDDQGGLYRSINPTITEKPTWLCPIATTPERRGILPISFAEYLQIIDATGRMIREDKRGAISSDLAPILIRLGANPDQWGDTVRHFRSRFRLVIGLTDALKQFSADLGRKWLQGFRRAQTAFGT